jgi:glycerophosphoryl diester phosphodiesterase
MARFRPTVLAVLLSLSTLVLGAVPALADDDAPARRTPLPVAHRGASGYAPENTLAAVDRAHDLGVEWVENDVQRTRDGELVVLHDTTLTRTTDAEEVFPDRAPWNVADFTAAEIARLDAGSWFGAAYAGARVPTLEQYLRRVTRNSQNLLMELKRPDLYPGIEAQTLKELDRAGWLDHRHVKRRLVVQSFDATSMRTVHELAPAVRTGFLGTPQIGELREYAAFTDQINPRFTTVSPEYVAAVHSLRGAHGRPLEVFTWTVDDGPTAASMAAAGVDGIISNKPDVVRAATSRAD